MIKPAAPYELIQGRYGPMLVNKLDFYIGHALIRYGEYCEAELVLMRHFIQQPGAIVEIGSNNGSQSVPLAQAARAVGAELIAFEPQPFLFQNLCANLALNALDNVTAWPFACAAMSGVLGFQPPDYTQLGNFGGIAMDKRVSEGMIAVSSVKVDELLANKNVHLMKIDVEGFEIDVLKGAADTISRCRPVIYVENDRRDRSAHLIEHLWQLNYRLWWHTTLLFNPDNFRKDPENIYPELASCNMLCIPREYGVRVEGLDEVRDTTYHPFAKRNISRTV